MEFYFSSTHDILKKLKNNCKIESFFFYGFAVIVLFLCAAKQLTWVYILPAIPLFSIWLALLFQKCRITLRQITGITALTGCILLITLGLGYWKIAYAMSTYHVIEKARAITPKDYHVIIIRRTPASAMFYHKGSIIPTGKKSWYRFIKSSCQFPLDLPNTFVMKRHTYKSLPEKDRECLVLKETVGKWQIYKTELKPQE